MLFKLLGLPVTLPAKGIGFVFEKVAELADQELNDESVVREQLLLLQLRLEEGEIEEEEYAQQEVELFARLRAIKERKKQLAQEELAALRAQAEEQVSGKRRVVVETALDEPEGR